MAVQEIDLGNVQGPKGDPGPQGPQGKQGPEGPQGPPGEFNMEAGLTFSEASTRTNINSGESLKTILGKIKKFFTDLKPHAFTDPVNNLTGTDPRFPLAAPQGKALDQKIAQLNSALEDKQDTPQKMRYYWITDETEVDSAIKSTAEYYFKNNMENNTCFNIYLSLKKGNTYRIDGLKVDNTYGYMQISSYYLSKPYYGTASGGAWAWS